MAEEQDITRLRQVGVRPETEEPSSGSTVPDRGDTDGVPEVTIESLRDQARGNRQTPDAPLEFVDDFFQASENEDEEAQQEALDKIRNRAKDIQNNLARIWFASEAMAEDDEDREQLRDTVSTVLGVFIGTDVFDEEALIAAGLEDAIPEQKDLSWKEKAGRLIGEALDRDVPILGVSLGDALEFVGRPGQGILAASAMVSEQTGLPIGPAAVITPGVSAAALAANPEAREALRRGVSFQQQEFAQDRLQTSEPEDRYSDIDRDSDSFINFREALGFDPDLGGDSWLGWAVGAGDTLGVALTDPASYAGFGGGTATRARAGLEAVQQVIPGRAGLQQVRNQGFRSLAPEVQEAVQRQLTANIRAGFEAGRRLPLRDRLRKIADVQQAQEQAVRRQTQRAVSGIRRPTSFALTVGGRNIPNPVSPALRQATRPLRRQFDEIRPTGNILDSPASGFRAKLNRLFGAENAGTTTPRLSDDLKTLEISVPIEPTRVSVYDDLLDRQVEQVESIDVQIHDDGTADLLFSNTAFDLELADDFFETTLQNLADEGFDAVNVRLNPTQRQNKDLLDYLQQQGFEPDGLGSGRLVRDLDPIRADDFDPDGFLTDLFDDPEDALRQRFGAKRTRAGLADVLGEPISRVGDLIRPRAAVRRAGGEGREQLVDDARVKISGVSTRKARETQQELAAAARKAATEFKGKLGLKVGGRGRSNRFSIRTGIRSADEHVRAALEGDRKLAASLGVDDAAKKNMNPDDFAELAAKKAERDGLPQTAAYIRKAVEVRAAVTDAAVRAGLPTPMAYYFPHTLTREGRRIFQELKEGDFESLASQGVGLTPPNQATQTAGEFTFQMERSPALAGKSIDEANEFLAKQLGQPEGTKIFEESVTAAYATRGRSAFKAAVETELFDGLQNEIVDGLPLIVRKTDVNGNEVISKEAQDAINKVNFDRNNPLNYETVETPAGAVYMPTDIAEEFAVVKKALTDDEWVKGFAEFRRNFSQIWGANATSPLIDGVGFHSRNAVGNILLNAVGGVINPVDYVRALKIQKIYGRAQSRVRSGASTWETVFDDMKGVLSVSEQNKKLINSLLDNEILGRGFYDDLAQGTTNRAKVYEILGNNRMIRSGRLLGSAVEDNARIAHYINKLDAPGGNAKSAARSVRTYLFDYGDLTGFERKIRYLSRFYTFMRKNTGVQLWSLTHYPGRVAVIERATRAQQSPIGTALGINQPRYSRERGDTIIDPFGLQGVAASIDTPFSAALETIAPVATLANLTPGLQDIVPGENTTEQDFLEDLVALTSGGERALLDKIYAGLLQKDIFTGRDLEDEGSEAKLEQWTDVVFGPVYSQLERFVSRATEGEGFGPIGNNPTTTEETIGHELLVLSNLLGLNVAPTGDRQQATNMYLVLRDLEQLVEDRGLPTLTQLRLGGLAPAALASPDRFGSEVTEGRLTELQALQEEFPGLDDTDLQEKLQEQLAEEERKAERREPDGTITTRTDRVKEFTLGLGYVTEAGNGKTDMLAKVLFNEANPTDQFIDDETGEPFDEYDLDVRWYLTRKAEVLEWAQSTGAPLTPSGDVGKATGQAWNAAFPDRPYYGKDGLDDDERVERGLRPVVGVYLYTDSSGQEFEIRPEGGGFVDLATVLGALPTESSLGAPPTESSRGLSVRDVLGEREND